MPKATILHSRSGYLPSYTVIAEPGKDYWALVIDASCEGLEIGTLTIKCSPSELSKESWIKSAPNGVSVRAKGVHIHQVHLQGLHVGIDIQADGFKCDAVYANLISGDVVQGQNVRSALIRNTTISDALEVRPFVEYHPDAFHFSGNCRHIRIENAKVLPSGHKWARQGYQFALFTDGVFHNCSVRDVDAPNVHPEHAVTFAEAHRCRVTDVTGGGAVRFRALNGKPSTDCKAYRVDGPVEGASNMEKRQMMTIESVLRDGLGVPGGRAHDIAPYIEAACEEFEINNPVRIAAFLANLYVESQQFTRYEENLRYSAKRLRQIFPKYFTRAEAQEYAGNPQRIANRVYANRMGNGSEESGDGWKHRGMCPIQLTGNYNQTRCLEKLGLDPNDPRQLLEPGVGYHAAGWFWQHNGLNELADRGTIHLHVDDEYDEVLAVRHKVNGGTNGLDEVRHAYEQIRRYMRLEIEPGHQHKHWIFSRRVQAAATTTIGLTGVIADQVTEVREVVETVRTSADDVTEIVQTTQEIVMVSEPLWMLFLKNPIFAGTVGVLLLVLLLIVISFITDREAGKT